MIGSRVVTMPPTLWTHRMDVYVVDPTTGSYTQQVQSQQLCRLCETSKKDAAAAPLRAAGVEARTLLFPPTLALDPLSQLAIGTSRYQIVAGSDQAARGPSGELVYRSVDVLRVGEPSTGPDL